MGYKADSKAVITFQMAKGEHKALKDLAAKENCSVSDLIRDAIFARYIEPTVSEDSELGSVKLALGVGHRAALDYLEKRFGKDQNVKYSELLGDVTTEFSDSILQPKKKRAKRNPSKKTKN